MKKLYNFASNINFDHHRTIPRSAIWLRLILVAAFAAVPCLEGKDDKKQEKAIIKYTSVEDGNCYIADMFSQISTKNTKTGKVTTCLKVGIFAEENTRGAIKNIKYKKKVIYSDQDFVKDSVKVVIQGKFYKDLENTYKKKLKTAKATKNEMLRRQKLLRLLSWCDTHFVPSFKKKVEKEIRKVDPDLVEEEKSDEFFERTGDQDSLVEALKALKDIKEVSLVASKHMTVASDFLPPKTLEKILTVGERVYRDFCENMYPENVKNLNTIPQGEIVRIYYLTHTTTLEDALKNASKFAPGLSDMKHGESIKMALILGGQSMSTTHPTTKEIMRVGFSALESRDRENPDDLDKIRKNSPAADYTNRLVSYLADALMDNWLGNPPAFKGRITMPWLAEGFSHYVCIKNLGVRGVSSTDFDFSYAWSEVGFGYQWIGDIEESIHRVAQEATASKIQDLFRIAHYRNLKNESVAKSVSLIDFFLESNKVAFLNFLKDLQKHYRKLDKTGNQTAFINGLDKLFQQNFGTGSPYSSGMASRLKRKTIELNSVADVEEAWRQWAARWVSGKKRR